MFGVSCGMQIALPRKWPQRFLFFLLFGAAFSTALKGQPVFDFNEGCRQAYRSIVHWKMAEGERLIKEEKAKNPNNLIPYFLENYIDFFVLFFNEDPEEYKRRRPHFDKRTELMARGPEHDPFRLFTRMVIQFQSAAIDVKFGRNWNAGWAFRRSFLLSRESVNRFPEFEPSKLYYGSLQIAASTIPDGYKWLSNLLGIRGDLQRGMNMLEQFLNDDSDLASLFRDEGIFFYLYLKFHVQNDRKGVFDFIKNQKLDLVNNHLFTYLAVNLSINDQRAAFAEQVLRHKNPSAGYFRTPIWDLEMGYIRLSQLKPDAAFYMKRFVRDFKGRFYLKDMLEKLSWFYYLNDDPGNAVKYKNLIATRGSVDTEADKNAQRFSKQQEFPDKTLLKARLLNDGGYYHRAIELLESKPVEAYSKPEEKLEYQYRMGRLYDDLNKVRESVYYYSLAVTNGENRKEYFAARSALQLGYIYERENNKEQAIKWFRRCMAMKGHEFKNSLDQKAKAGIRRLNAE